MCEGKIKGAKGILVFPLPEERDEFLLAAQADKLASVIWDLDEELRSLVKYENDLVHQAQCEFENDKKKGYIEEGEEMNFEYVADFIAAKIRDNLSESMEHFGVSWELIT